MSWETIILGSAFALAVVILLGGSQPVYGSVGIDQGGVTVTPSNTNASSQGTP